MRWVEGDTASSIAERFVRQAERAPGAIAIASGARKMTYGELHALSARWAQALPDLGARADDRGARALLLFDHGELPIVGALAALKAGYTVMTLNPGDSPARHAELRTAVRPAVLLTEEAHLATGRAAGFDDLETLVISRTPSHGLRGLAEAELPDRAPDDLAFLISTSGSTGRPKVIMQSHRNLLYTVLRYTNSAELVPDDRVAWLTSLGGGHALHTVWSTLLNGATLCPFGVAERGMVGLGRWLKQTGITVLPVSPSFLRSFTRTLHGERMRGVRVVRLSSEAAVRADFDLFCRHFASGCVLVSVLATSEAGMVSAGRFGPHDDPPLGNLPVGKTLEGIALRLLDEHGCAVPEGEPGEIVLEGRYLSPGYWDEPELTAACFSEQEGGTRRFRTGDIGRRLGSGQLQVLGRADLQVKIRGYRLQLEEVEAALAVQPGVLAAAADARQDRRGDTKLIGYLVAADGTRLDQAAIRAELGRVLPRHAVPSALLPVEALPLTATGKLDRRRLRELDPLAEPAAPPSEPAPRAAAGWRDLPAADALLELAEVRRRLQGIWEEALDRRPIGHGEDFFALGGDSLQAMHMLVAVEQEFSCALTPGTLLRAPTIERLARIVYRAGPRVLPAAEDWEGVALGNPPLFMAYPLGGHGLRYRPLAQALGAEFRLHVLESPWWDGRPSEIHTVEQLAAHHLSEIRRHQPVGPYVLGGYSGGGLIALEVARQLHAAGEEVGLLAVIDSYIGEDRGAGADPRNRARSSARLPFGAAAGGLALGCQTALWRAGQFGRRAIGPPRRARWWLDHRLRGTVPERRRAPYVQHLVSAALSLYRPPPYSGRVVLFRCADDTWPAPDRGWTAIASELQIRDLRANHFNVLKPPQVHELGEALAELMRGVYPGAPRTLMNA